MLVLYKKPPFSRPHPFMCLFSIGTPGPTEHVVAGPTGLVVPAPTELAY